MILRDTMAALFVLALPTLGCVPKSPPPAPPPEHPPAVVTRSAPEIPPDLRAEVGRAERLGQEIYLYDKASAIGTDALVERLGSLDGRHLGGYLTLLEGDTDGKRRPSFAVLFFTDAKEPQIAYQIRVPTEPGAKPTVEKLDPPATPSEGVRALIRARQTAIAELREFAQPLNPLVFPGQSIGGDGLLVYLLAGTTRPRVAVFGRHYRVLVSADGRTVRRFEPLSKSMLEVPFDPPDPADETKALMVSHLISNAPLETHVFTSLLHRLPIFVVTSRGHWRVADGRITFMGPQSP